MRINSRLRYLSILMPGLIGLYAVVLCGCDKNIYAPAGVIEPITIPYSIVSILQNEDAATVNIDIKIPDDKPSEAEIKLLSKSGQQIALRAGENEHLANFTVQSYQANGLVANEQYILTIAYKDAQQNLISISRSFTSIFSPNWNRRSHAPITSGDYSGAALISPLYGSQIAVYRYKDQNYWDILKYGSDGVWYSLQSNLPLPRHEAIAFPVGQEGSRELIFVGFGYLTDENLPGQRAFLSDFWWVPRYSALGEYAGIVFPTFSGIQKTVKHFLTFSTAFMIKEEDTGEMESIEVTWDRKQCTPMPEGTGKIATFTLGETGYVINQKSGQQPHLFAYDTHLDQWTKMADFPGVPRVNGVAFSVNQKGFFGLGVDAEGNGLRDIWEYDADKNKWTYHSEYPGQGNRYLIALSDKTRAFIGWGYEARNVEGSSARQQVGCTDFWEFNP